MKTKGFNSNLSRQFIQEARKVANKLATYEFSYVVKEKAVWNGKDLKLSGITNDVDTIDDEEEYMITMPATYLINHLRRLRKLTRHCKDDKEAIELVKDYITRTFKDVRGNMEAANN